MEVCVDSVASAVNAAEGGASRIELCSALSEGGLTPTLGFLQVVKSLVKIPVFVMIRPRRGLDFVYSQQEVDIMEIDIQSFKKSSADGFVFGALTTDRQVDEKVCNRLFTAATPLPCTFHRAFDIVSEPFKALEIVVRIGFTRILTSGQEQNALKGVKLISNLVKRSDSRVVIMPGAGVTENNLETILKETGAEEFHASARTEIKDNINSCSFVCKASMGTSDSDLTLFVTDRKVVENMVKISTQVWDENKDIL